MIRFIVLDSTQWYIGPDPYLEKNFVGSKNKIVKINNFWGGGVGSPGPLSDIPLHRCIRSKLFLLLVMLQIQIFEVER